VVPGGAEVADPAAFFRSVKFRRILQRMRDHADLVIIDSPPLLAVSDTLAIAREVDGIVLVVDQGMSLDALAEARRRLDFVVTPVLGYVFNRADAGSELYAPYAYSMPQGPAKQVKDSPS
jgi:Mrp family chromosome partitioning ATPase